MLKLCHRPLDQSMLGSGGDSGDAHEVLIIFSFKGVDIRLKLVDPHHKLYFPLPASHDESPYWLKLEILTNDP